MAQSRKLVDVERLSFGYTEHRPVLRDISFSLDPGKMLAIMGPNGCGKSTLLKLLRGELTPTHQPRVGHLPAAFVPAEEPVAEGMTVYDYVLLGRTPHMGYWGWPSATDREVVDAHLKAFQASAFARRFMSELSSGELQRVRLCRALVQDTPLVLLDEPASHLDLKYQHELFQRLKEYCIGSKKSFIVTLHQPWQASAYFNQVLLIYADGSQAGFGPPTEWLTVDLIRKVFNLGSYWVPGNFGPNALPR